MGKKHICYISGTRADYGLMKRTLKEIEKEFRLSLVVTGMHLSPKFGSTIEQIEKDGFKIAQKVDMLSSADTGAAMAKSLGRAVIGITRSLESIKPDVVLIMGDRAEALAGAMAGAYLNMPVVHIHGGDQGDDGAHIDDSVRHSITKFAHVHLPATEASAARIRKMGEEEWRIHVVGSPALDDIYSGHLSSRKDIEKKYHLNLEKPLILIIQHPVLTQVNDAGKQMKETLEALKEINEQTVLIYPNADAGGGEMIKVIKEYEKHDFLHTYKSLPRKDYLSLMKYATVMVGNSSSGSIDAPSFKLPVVNIGIRESVREHAGNKIFVAHDRKEIVKAVRKAMFDKDFKKAVRRCVNPYGDGKTAARIIEVLQTVFSMKREKLLTKKLTY